MAKDKTETRKNFYNLDRLDILFVSHLVSVSHLNIAEDFYYGNLNDELSKNNFKYAYALIDYTNDKNTSKYLKASNTPRIILQKYLSYKGESCIYKRMRQCKRLILGKMPVKISKFDGRVWKTAAENATSGQSMHSLRVGLQIGSLIKKYKPKMIVTTFEGHAWERMVFNVARNINPSIKCAGYQHASMFKNQHAISRKIDEKYDPDLIFTCGTPSKNWLADKWSPEVRVIELGSPRHIKRAEILRGDKSNLCVVLPEGTIEDVLTLFDFTLICAKSMPHIKFIWRLHPNMSNLNLKQLSPVYADIPQNIELSQGNLMEDLKISKWAIYRGSTSIIQAASFGCQPVFYKVNGLDDFDPLFSLQSWKKVISSKEDFMAVTLNSMEFSGLSEAEIAQEYCAKLYSPLRPQILIEQLRKC